MVGLLGTNGIETGEGGKEWGFRGDGKKGRKRCRDD